MTSIFGSPMRAASGSLVLLAKKLVRLGRSSVPDIRSSAPRRAVKFFGRVSIAASLFGIAATPAAWASTGCDALNAGAVTWSGAIDTSGNDVNVTPPASGSAAFTGNSSDELYMYTLSNLSFTAGDKIKVKVVLGTNMLGWALIKPSSSDPVLSVPTRAGQPNGEFNNVSKEEEYTILANTTTLEIRSKLSTNNYPGVGAGLSTITVTCTPGAGPASQLAFGTQPSNTVSNVAINPSPTVRILDASGVLTNSTAAVTIAIGTNPGSGALAGTATVNAVNGVATFNGISINKTGTNYTLSAISSGLTSATSGTFNITPGATTQFTVTAPSTATQGAAFNTLSVTAKDAAGNNTPGYSGTVHFTSTDGAAVLPANTTLASGTGTFSATLNTVGAQTITATDTVTGSINGTTGTITVVSPAPTASNASANAAYSTGSPAVPTSIDLTASIANASFVSPASNPAHGTLDVAVGANAAGKTLVYTPTAGYHGTDSFTYRAVASDGTTVSASPATVTVTVADPVLTASLTGSGAAAGAPLSGYSITTSGGLGTRTCAPGATAPPAWLTVNSDCTLTGTPPSGGTVNFSVNVTDQSNPAFTATNRPIGFSILSNNADLSNLVVNNGAAVVSLTPGFAAGTTSYTASVASGVTSVTVTPTVSQANATVTVNTTGVTSGSPSAPINLVVGTNTITTHVTAQDGVTVLDYVITLTRATPAPTISSLSRSGGPTAGGTSVTINGTNLTGATVTVDGTGVPSSNNVGTSLDFVTPAHVAGAVVVAVTTPGGTATTSFDYVAPVSFSPAAGALPGGTSGASYSQSFTAGGGTGPYSFNATGTLPPGLTFVGGVLSGTPTGVGSYSFDITVTDSTAAGSGGPLVRLQSYTLQIASPVIILAPATLATGTIAASYNDTINASGGIAPYDLQVTSGSLPPGLSMSSAGVITGTPTGAGIYNFTVTARDSSTGAAAPYSGSAAYQITIAAPTIVLNPANPANPTAGVAYTATLSASGGTAPYSFALANGTTLPAGLTLSSTGTISGTPSQGGSFSFDVTATDNSTGTGAPFTVTHTYSFTVGAATITVNPASLPNGRAGTAYSQTITASGGNGSYTFSTTGPLPAGWTLSPSGVLSGTATESNSFNFTITATDSSTGTGAPYSGARAYTGVDVLPPNFTLTPPTLAATVGQAYTGNFVAGGGTAPYTYSKTGTLPPGMTLATDGTLSGTPTATGTFNFTVIARDTTTGAGSPFAVGSNYNFTVSAATLVLSPASLPNGKAGVSYSETVNATGGTTPYSYTLDAGTTLPVGLTLNASTGAISGTPTAAGVFNFTIRATDSSTGAGAPFSTTQNYSVTIDQPTITITPATVPAGMPGSAYSQTLTASGGTSGYSFTLAAGSTLPVGVTLSTGGVLAGTPTSAGTFAFTVDATDSTTGTGAPFKGSQAYSLVIGTPTITVDTTTLPAATVAGAYSQTLAASGGTGPYHYSVTGTLPAGLTLSTAGVLSGTPTEGGSFTLTVTATDSSGGSGPFSGNRTLGLTVNPPAITLAPATLTNATVGAAYTKAITATGGTGTYSFTTTDTLPAGITLATNGTLSGTPTQSGSFTFTVKATDQSTGTGAPYSGTQSYTLIVGGPTLVLSPATLTNGAIGVAYTASVSASGGTAPYHFEVSAGALPAGITLNAATGAIAGTPTAGGPFNFTIKVTDSSTGTGAPYAVTQAYTLTIGAPTVAVTPTTLPNGQMGVAYSQALTASGGTAGYTFTSTGTLPAGVTLTAAGLLSGTPTVHGTFNFTVSAQDSSTGAGPYTGSVAYTLVIATPVVPVANAATANVAYGSSANVITPTLGGGTATSVAVVTAPTHGTVTVSGLTFSYTPATGYHGADSFTYTATNDGGTSAPATVSLTVVPPPPPNAAPGNSTVAGSTTTTGTSVQINLSALVTGVYDSIQIAGQPAHGTVTLSGGAGPSLNPVAAAPVSPYIATYTPTPNYAGADSFTYVAVGPGGSSAPGTVTVTVVGQVPVATPKTATAGDGQLVSVMLTDGAQRGPFTGATVVSMLPANAATTAVVAAGSGAYRLDVTPNNRFGGTIVVTYALSNTYGVSAPSTVTVTVQARPDPRNDPDVAAISDAQAETARRFARAQVSNFMRRTEQLHNGGGTTGLAMGVTLGSRDGMAVRERPDDRNWGLAITERMRVSGEDPALGQVVNDPRSPLSRADQLGYGRSVAATGGTGSVGARDRGNASAAAPGSGGSGSVDEDGNRRVGSLATWAGGAIDIGTQDKRTDRSKISATTAGLSAGADIKLAEGVLVGVGGGYGNDLSRIGTAAQVRGTSTLYAAYASLQPVGGTFIDGMLGRGQLDFTTRRIAAAVNATARGSRDGSYTVAAISLGVDRSSGPLQWSIYGRGEYLDADLDAYAESGAGRYNLRFDARQVRSVTGTVGGRFEYRQKTGFGSVTPRIRVEWNHEFADLDAQWLDYADIPGAAIYDLAGRNWKRDQLQLSIGTRFDILSSGWSFDFETGLRAGQGEKAGTLQIRLSKRF
ncbi:putative Ig domain-containing protein [Sphingomonas kyeonggiensis]|uniref:Uncharacterized protein YhjY with autotransporter beta-barrel domain n=1 Tax=Sphingomonas kyeonggiensis TaxID=1268553 RepID=A0A7W6JNZ1_9SPHN|nr:putative Ig domain-containing protein [Sphingomonas kyeonggiensis]MBB4096888.1 uncharacterized protein YhjY with autotransporter beta-barrel domain [Sphingomonas kyeonggiensis]